jgi:pimeloyl-ACP methyl ester carboxylesterase
LRRGLGRRCRFLQYDYVGVGGSSAKTAPFSMLDLADELRDLLDVLSVECAHLLGISKGSLVAQAFLIRHRERVRSFCGLGNPNVLSEGLEPTFAVFQERIEALEDMKELWPQRVNRKNYARVFCRVYVPAMFLKGYADLSLAEWLRAFLVKRMVYYADLSLAEWLRAFLVKRMVYPALEGTFIQTMVDLFRYYVGDIAQEVPAFAEGLPKVRGVPILLLNGTADTTVPVQMSRELVPEAELVEFEGVTHMGPMMLKREARLVFERYVAFVEGVLS